MKKPLALPSAYMPILVGAFMFFGLYLTSRYSYLLFHSLAELFSIVVACGIFVLFWNARQWVGNSFFLFMGVAYLFVGGMDLLHTLAYKGMGVFPGQDANLPTQLWIAARYVESLSLLVALLLLGRGLKLHVVLLGYTVTVSLLLGAIFHWQVFPLCFVDGVGLTPFKKTSEYVISFLLLMSAVLLFRRRREFERRVWQWLIASVLVTIGSELAFTLYVHAYGLPNLAGHFLKILSFYLIYKAFIETALVRPYTLLFRDLKRSEEALRRNEERFRMVADLAYDWEYWIDPNGRYLYISPSCERITGYPPEAFREDAHLLEKIVHPDDRTSVEGHFAGGEKAREVTSMDFRILTRGGEEHWIHHICRSVYSEDGQYLGQRATNRDVTDHRRAEEALQENLRSWNERLREEVEQKTQALMESQQFLQSVIDSIPDVIKIVDEEYRILYVNRIGEEMADKSVNDLVGKTCYREFRDLTEPCPFCPTPDTFKTGQIGHASYQFVDHQGEHHIVEVSSFPIFDETGRVTRAIEINRDVTERRQLEDEVLRKEKLAYVGGLAAGVAHEIRNPLNSIITATRLLGDGQSDLLEEDRRALIDVLQDESKRLNTMLTDFLSFARPRSPKLELNPVNEIIEEVLGMLRRDEQIGDRIRIEEKLTPDMISIPFDRDQIKQVLWNVALNAVQAMPEGGTLTVYSVLEEKYVRITFRDTGEGIPEDVLERIFEPFYTLKKAGSGLGLAIVQQIMDAHRGRLSVQSQMGQGTTVEVYIPRP